jgi:hypothetical protein
VGCRGFFVHAMRTWPLRWPLGTRYPRIGQCPAMSSLPSSSPDHAWLVELQALPLNSPAGLMGCYSFYSTYRDGFGEQDLGQLEVFAGNAAGAVAVAVKLADRARLSEDLHQALASRAVIDRQSGS